MKKLIPADTVDAKGNVWETVGENIRNGANKFSDDDIRLLVNILFPIGSVYCGENAFILSVGKWEQSDSGKTLPVIYSTDILSSSLTRSTFVVGNQQTRELAISLRMWKRVE
jgi:hypothetical protein|nr:MAG TPA_asm: hypothetical protein [Caudoviricetes sp.]